MKFLKKRVSKGLGEFHPILPNRLPNGEPDLYSVQLFSLHYTIKKFPLKFSSKSGFCFFVLPYISFVMYTEERVGANSKALLKQKSCFVSGLIFGIRVRVL